jgi:hypothetical protein
MQPYRSAPVYSAKPNKGTCTRTNSAIVAEAFVASREKEQHCTIWLSRSNHPGAAVPETPPGWFQNFSLHAFGANRGFRLTIERGALSKT